MSGESMPVAARAVLSLAFVVLALPAVAQSPSPKPFFPRPDEA